MRVALAATLLTPLLTQHVRRYARTPDARRYCPRWMHHAARQAPAGVATGPDNHCCKSSAACGHRPRTAHRLAASPRGTLACAAQRCAPHAAPQCVDLAAAGLAAAASAAATIFRRTL